MMEGISGVSSGGAQYYSQIASGTRLQSAADGAAELSIVEKEHAQINGYDQGVRNAQDAKNLITTADGAVSGIADNLNRMRELAVQASNTAILSNDDLRMIQDEIDQLKQGISDIANNTEFNKKHILDGSFQDEHVAANADASGTDISVGAMTLQSLGIENFDVTSGNFSIDDIDKALEKVGGTRSELGAQSNGIDYMAEYSRLSSENLTSATSRMEDADIAKVASELQKTKLLQSYQLMMQKKQQEEESKKYGALF